jgi:YggT family protein
MVKAEDLQTRNKAGKALITIDEDATILKPLLGRLPIRNIHFKGFYYCGFIVSFVIAVVFFTVLVSLSSFDILLIALFSIILTIKSFGYLLIFLLLAQALTSWLPNTRYLSMTFAQITYPIVSPVQKLIPPIGMIDLSLMIVMIALFALNTMFGKLFGILWYIC